MASMVTILTVLRLLLTGLDELKKTIIVLFGLTVFASLQLASAVVLETGTVIEPSGSNTTYVMGDDFSFTNVIINDDAPYFNDYIFQIEPDTGTATVMINSWNPPTMEFEVNTTDETSMTLGGFTPSTSHGVYVDGAYWEAVTADVFGTVSFTYSLFSTHVFSFGAIPLSPSGPPPRPKPSEVPEAFEIPRPERVDIIPWIILCVSISIIMLVVLLIKTRKEEK